MSEETVAQKITSLQRCVSQAREALSTAGPDFRTSHLLQDAAVLGCPLLRHAVWQFSRDHLEWNGRGERAPAELQYSGVAHR